MPDPDGLVGKAAFFPPAEAVSRLQRHALPHAMREPAVACIAGAAETGTSWSYRALPNGVQLLLTGNGPPA